MKIAILFLTSMVYLNFTAIAAFSANFVLAVDTQSPENKIVYYWNLVKCTALCEVRRMGKEVCVRRKGKYSWYFKKVFDCYQDLCPSGILYSRRKTDGRRSYSAQTLHTRTIADTQLTLEGFCGPVYQQMLRKEDSKRKLSTSGSM
ncbi:uncharacterized protein LOC117170681 isoform X3 [Belonocnema kinseyi]|uniref:uncharacterized protein LOC117170681 isoform X3 n=1 Tax=Belonocnema kinseyi TaxID=2817044 RepID=UPI00143D5D69|nr:uncharacterized protein LOC117170681 isoform X3 [Belonocnema kinseyi]